MTIHDIILDRDYRKFAAWATEHGMQVAPDAYPWRFMGISEEKFMRTPLRNRSGALITDEVKRMWLAVVKTQERLVEVYWDLWLEEQQTHSPVKRPPPATATREPDRLLFGT